MKANVRACILSLLLPLSLQGQDIGLLRAVPDRPAVRGSASVWGGGETGGYHPAFAAASQWKAGAEARGTRHGERTSWTGSFSFEQAEGKGMFTSMFLEPGYFPVDVLEFTPGDKTRQTYRMDGGILTEVADGIGVGGQVSYSAANYAKRKDIRHTTYGMNLRVEPTLAFWDTSGGGAVAYVFRKRTESIDAEQVGSATDESFYAFLDKGMRYGAYQVWDGDGIHLDEAGVGVFPVREYAHGFAGRFDVRGALSGGFEFLWKRGTVGEKGYDWFRYPGVSSRAHLERTWQREKTVRTLRLGIDLQSDQLREAVLDKVSAGGVTTPRIYGYNAVSDRAWGVVELDYGLRFRTGSLRKLQAGFRGGAWEEKSYLTYPYEDRTRRLNGKLTLAAGFVFGPLDLDLRLSGGKGTWQDEGLHGDSQEAGNPPFRLEADWLRKMEYFSTENVGAGLSLVWHLPTVPGLSFRLDGNWLHGFGVVLLPGAERVSGTLTAGYAF